MLRGVTCLASYVHQDAQGRILTPPKFMSNRLTKQAYSWKPGILSYSILTTAQAQDRHQGREQTGNRTLFHIPLLSFTVPRYLYKQRSGTAICAGTETFILSDSAYSVLASVLDSSFPSPNPSIYQRIPNPDYASEV